jgi:alpha-galactosidase
LLGIAALMATVLLSGAPALSQAKRRGAGHRTRHAIHPRRHSATRHRRRARHVKRKRHRRKRAAKPVRKTASASTPAPGAGPTSVAPDAAAAAAGPDLAPVPYMGWNTYYGLGGGFNEQTVLDVANALLDRGLAHAGYRIVWLDFGWVAGARDAGGNLIVDSSQWPDGLAGLTAWLHQHGLEAGIYTDAGSSGCSGQGVGSAGHYQQDADQFAAWGFDAVKVDFCGAGQAGLAPQQAYTDFANALR